MHRVIKINDILIAKKTETISTFKNLILTFEKSLKSTVCWIISDQGSENTEKTKPINFDDSGHQFISCNVNHKI